MSIKKLINGLFKLSGGQAMPATNRIVIYEGSSVINDQTYTPTKNGYFCIDNYSTETGANSYIQGAILNYVTQSGGRSSIVLPVQKGQKVVYSATGSGNKTVRFFDLVGGGLRAFCRKLCRGFGEVCYG